VARGAVIPVPLGEVAVITGFFYQPAQKCFISGTAVLIDNPVQRVAFNSRQGRDHYLIKPQIDDDSTAANRGSRNDYYRTGLWLVHDTLIGVSIDIGAYSEPVAAANPQSVYSGQAQNVLGIPGGAGGVTHYSGLILRGQGGVSEQPLTQGVAAQLGTPPGPITTEQVDLIPEVALIHWGDVGTYTFQDSPVPWVQAPFLSVDVWFVKGVQGTLNR
jgi:hypothetical protein